VSQTCEPWQVGSLQDDVRTKEEAIGRSAESRTIRVQAARLGRKDSWREDLSGKGLPHCYLDILQSRCRTKLMENTWGSLDRMYIDVYVLMPSMLASLSCPRPHDQSPPAKCVLPRPPTLTRLPSMPRAGLVLSIKDSSRTAFLPVSPVITRGF
jgi:hypothetical protein